MPCAACTTGSPSLSSDRSLINASTLLTCSWPRRRRRGVVPVANSSFSVMNWIVRACAASGSNQKKPSLIGAAVIATFSSLASNSASVPTLIGSMAWSRSMSSSVSRRPSLSATSRTR